MPKRLISCELGIDTCVLICREAMLQKIGQCLKISQTDKTTSRLLTVRLLVGAMLIFVERMPLVAAKKNIPILG
ncbi:unnamed protein product [Clavelina lepadiformis]|uniref:Uncharacterized protein n=1 Tax=Clavelina lepadiformis TaxID=159417 RepID=A0ABP0GZ18_CLALP